MSIVRGAAFYLESHDWQRQAMRKLLQALAKIDKYPPIAIPRDAPMLSPSLCEAIDFWEGLPARGAMK